MSGKYNDAKVDIITRDNAAFPVVTAFQGIKEMQYPVFEQGGRFHQAG